MSTPTIQSILKATDVIELLAAERALTAAECSETLGYPLSSVYRMLATLCQTGLVERDSGGRFCLGLRLLELSACVPRRRQLSDRARRPMEEMCDSTGLQSNLATLNDGVLVYVESVHGRSSSTPVRVGQRGVLHAAGVGKTLLAFASGALIDHVAASGLKAYTPHTIVDDAELRREVYRIQERGFAVDRQEVLRGLSCIAMPVRDRLGTVVAALSLSGNSERVESELRHLRDELNRTIRVVEAGIGWQPGLDDFLTLRASAPMRA